MEVASPATVGCEKIQAVGVPVIDLSCKKAQVLESLVKACEEYGLFKLINHGVPKDVIRRMEEEGQRFFGRPASEKRRAGPPDGPDPLDYGSKNIGFNGDMGEIEYLLLPTNPLSIAQRSKVICRDPVSFCCVVNDYIEAVRGLACEMLELLAEGLRIKDKRTLSRLIEDSHNDSVFRLNHYPSCKDKGSGSDQGRIGFREQSDPMMLTILRSNDVGGFQISVKDGVWIPIQPDPCAFYINVGDALQAFTNGRFMSVRHRAVTHSMKPRMSTMYFAAPPLHARISPLPKMVTPQNPCRYRPFTWAEYKKTAYSLRLGDSRLKLFTTLT